MTNVIITAVSMFIAHSASDGVMFTQKSAGKRRVNQSSRAVPEHYDLLVILFEIFVVQTSDLGALHFNQNTQLYYSKTVLNNYLSNIQTEALVRAAATARARLLPEVTF
jgi:hypothetical protein